MKPNLRIRYASLSALSAFALGGVALMGNPACTTTEVNSDGGGSSSGGGGSSSGTTSSGSSSGGSGSGGNVDSGADAGLGVAPDLLCPSESPMAPASGPVLIPPANAMAVAATLPDGGNFDGGPFLVRWGNFQPFGAGTYFYPNNNGIPGPGTDVIAQPDAGNYCTTLASQNSFVGAYSVADDAFHLSGTVATYSGVGIYLSPCLDAHAYSGIQFTVQGDVGDEGAQADSGSGSGGDATTAADAGTGGQMTFQITQATDLNADSGNMSGRCTTTCTPASITFSVTSSPTVIQVKWADLMSGSPYNLTAPSQITGLQWQYNWPCAVSPTPFTTNVTISNIQFMP